MSLWSQFFGEDPKKLFLSFTPESSFWRVVSWNYDLSDPKHRRLVVEVHKPTGIDSIEWSKEQHEELKFFHNLSLLRKRRIPTEEHELKTLMNIAIHSTIKSGLELNHEFILTPVTGATTLDYQNEAKALQWIQASFGTLGRALDKVAGHPDLILTASLFLGEEPESKTRLLRLIAFNLDIFYYLLPDHTLQIAIFDDKNLGQGSAKAPTFQQIIKVTKPQLYDEIVKLVHRIATVGEIR